MNWRGREQGCVAQALHMRTRLHGCLVLSQARMQLIALQLLPLPC